MSIGIACPGCSAKLNAPDSAAGKKIKCPKCQTVCAVPAPAAPAFEVVEDPESASKPAPQSARPTPEESPGPEDFAACGFQGVLAARARPARFALERNRRIA